MRNILRPIKSAVKKTPLWPMLRPRRIHVYGVGAPKTGTVSLARLFEHFRSGHERHPAESLRIIQDERSGELDREDVLRALRSRDRRRRLEVESAHFLVHLAEYLRDLYPESKFICTVRAPAPWLRSIIDQCINKPRQQLPRPWRKIHDLAFGPPPNEYPAHEECLGRYGLRSLDQYLRYWCWHNEQILDTIPKDRRIFVRTANLSSRLSDIASFLDLPVTHLRQVHSHRTSEKHGVLQHIDRKYVLDKIRDNCKRVVERLDREASVSVELSGDGAF
jgi:hypothetical protein